MLVVTIKLHRTIVILQLTSLRLAINKPSSSFNLPSFSIIDRIGLCCEQWVLGHCALPTAWLLIMINVTKLDEPMLQLALQTGDRNMRILLDAIAAGQMQASGTLQDFGATTAESSRGMALIDILDDISPYQIPVGSAAEVAIYTDHLEGLSLLRKILLRMKRWKNYIFLESL
jgi:hypothetical protein